MYLVQSGKQGVKSAMAFTKRRVNVRGFVHLLVLFSFVELAFFFGSWG